MTREPLLRLAAVFLVWNLAIGLIRNPEALADYYTIEFIAGAVLLPVFLGGLWLVCRKAETARLLTGALAWSGLAAAVAGILYWWLVQSVDEPGARLRNPLVHGGQHPVGTAITIGFTLVCSAAIFGGLMTRKSRALCLVMIAVQSFAVMLTLSRGALLALCSVPIALFLIAGVALLVDLKRGLSFREALRPLTGGWQGVWPPLLTTAAVAAAFFQFLAPLLAPSAEMRRLVPGAEPVEVINLATLTHNPLQEYIARSDSGRSDIYRIGFSCLDTWDKHLTGSGLWGPELELERITQGQIDHLHSLIVATYVHGGVIGFAMLLVMIGLGLVKSWRLARAGEPQWLAFLAYGLGGLIFDGQSACSLVTHPRFENLILWFPLIAVAARWRNRQESVARLSQPT